MKIISLPLLTLRTNAEPPLSSASDAILYFDATTGKIMASLGGSSYVVFGEGSGGGGGTLGPNTVGTIELKTNAVTDIKFRQSDGLSLVGRASNTTGNVADIIASSDGQVLRRSGTSIGFGTIQQSSVVSLVSDLSAKAIGVGTSTDNAIVRFDGSGGKLLQNSLVTVSDTGQLIGIADPSASSHAANKNYVDLAVSGAISGLDGDKGDIVVSSLGTSWLIDSNAVTLSKIQQIGTDSLLGRDSAGTGNVEVITLDSSLVMNGSGVLQRAALTGDVTASAGSNTTTIGAGVVTDSKLRNSSALSLIGRSANSTGVVADITAVAASGSVLRESGGGTIGFGTISTPGIANGAVSLAKIQNIITDRLIGRDTAGTGSPEEIALNSTLEWTGTGSIQRAALTGDVVASAGSNTTTISAGVVSDSKLRNSSALSIIGRSANSTGVVADISTTATSGAVLRESGSVLGFGTVDTAGITNAAVTNDKLRNSTGLSVIGNSTNSSATPADIVAAADGDIFRRSGTTVGFGTVPATSVTVASGGWDGYNIFSGATNVQQVVDAIDSAITMTPGASKVVQALPEGVIDFNWTLNDCGNGCDGDIVVNGPISLEQDRQYRRVTVLPGGEITCDTSTNDAGGWVFRAQIVDCRTADAKWIRTKQSSLIPTTAVGSAGGSNGALAVHYAGTTGGSSRPSGGPTGVAGVGVAGAAAPAVSVVGGYTRGKGGNGGAGVSGAGGTGGTSAAATIMVEPRTPGNPALMWSLNAQGGGTTTIAYGGAVAATGAAGAGDGTNAGGGGGSGGYGTKPLDIRIGILIVGSNTNAPMIDGSGSSGGGGGTPPAGNCGGGGGGGGGAGTRVYVDIGHIISTGDITGFITAAGGNGGAGGDGVGTGIGGTGGDGGGGGKIVYIRRRLGTTTIVDNRATAAASATVASTITGTAGTAGVAASANLLT